MSDAADLKKACRECTLPICDDRAAECKFVQIMRSVGITEKGYGLPPRQLPGALNGVPKLIEAHQQQIRTAALGFQKYDRRRRDARGYWRKVSRKDAETQRES